MELPIDIETVKGFLDPAEGQALFDCAKESAQLGPIVEIGTYCAKSTVYLGTAVKPIGGAVFSVDHHRGSEENQPGWEYHDTELWDEAAGAMDTLPFARETIFRAGLEDTVSLIVGRASTLGTLWTMPIGMLFIDGGHTMTAALNDYRLWTRHVCLGGVLAIHDVFPNPEDGGRPPFEIYKMALASNLFEEVRAVKSLRILKRLGAAS